MDTQVVGEGSPANCWPAGPGISILPNGDHFRSATVYDSDVSGGGPWVTTLGSSALRNQRLSSSFIVGLSWNHAAYTSAWIRAVAARLVRDGAKLALIFADREVPVTWACGREPRLKIRSEKAGRRN
jgi:hypothetical protein